MAPRTGGKRKQRKRESWYHYWYLLFLKSSLLLDVGDTIPGSTDEVQRLRNMSRDRELMSGTPMVQHRTA